MAYLEVRDISKSYGIIKALDNVSFSVEKGEYFCILGPTGAGKTTLLKVIAGLLKPDKGRVYIDGEDVTYLPPEARNTAYMPQGYALFPHMTVWDNVAYGALMKNLSLEVAEKSLKMVDLLHRSASYPHELSGGQQQRVALARVIASSSSILLLDEPLSALDLLLNIELRYELRRYAKKLGLTVLHVTHNAEEALSIADRLLILRKGVVQQIDRPDKIYLQPRNLFVAKFLGEITVLEGAIRRRYKNKLLIEIKDLGPIIVKSNNDIKNNHVIVAYRPEDIKILDSSDNSNIFKGKIEDVEFEGLRTRIHVRFSSNVKAVIDRWFDKGIHFRPNDYVYVYLPPNKALVFEYPREGLAKALALE